KNPSLAFRLVKYFHKLGIVDEERMEQARRTHGSADYRAAEGVMRDVLVTVVNESYEKELDNLPVPVRMLWGADDAAAPVPAARQAYDRLIGRGADATFEVLDGVGHDVHLERPDRVLAILNDLGLSR
ncbi:MAG: alpha/beta fold hydrolase, partial [Acidimicrobiia bacterium]|nr:alpha/beta fold hydrolase [Acidimicrobiia bacterium]